MLHQLIEKIIFLIGDLWYTGIFIMMTIESSFIPFPSEVAMIPAGYLSSTGQMNFMIAFLAGTFWAILGASINYFGWNYLWRPVVKRLIEKYGKYFLLKMDHYEKTEKYFEKHGSITTLVGRFIPAVRQLISIPAGIFQMNYFKFIFYTAIGAGSWNLILMTIWYIAGENRELISRYTGQATILVVVAVLIIIGWYYISQKKK